MIYVKEVKSVENFACFVNKYTYLPDIIEKESRFLT